MPLSAFKIECQRQKLAYKKDLIRLKSLYSSKLPEIKDLNNPTLWDDIYEKEEYLNTQNSITKDRVRSAVKFVSKNKGRVLDIAAGLGFVEEVISIDKEKEIYANDFSVTSVKIMKKRFKGNFSVQSIYDLEYEENSFDVILALEILEHIKPSRIFSVLRSINRLLKNNGFLIVSVPLNERFENMKNNQNGHVRMYTQDLIKAELEIAGFKVIKYKTLFAFENFYAPKTIIAKLFKTRKPDNIVLKTIKV